MRFAKTKRADKEFNCIQEVQKKVWFSKKWICLGRK
jgi:hypothetical protein